MLELVRDARVRICLAVLVFSRPAGAAGADEFAFPDTPVGKGAAAYLEAFNSLDAEAFRTFADAQVSDSMTRQMALPKQVEFHQGVWAQTGRLEAREIVKQSPHALTIIAKAAKGDQWIRLELSVEADPPHRISGYRIVPAASPSVTKKGYSGWSDLSELLAKVEPDIGAPGMAVAVVHDGKIADRAVWGVRRVGRKDRIGKKDRFHLGSVTKSITATMIGALVERGDLRWDITIGEALPDIEVRSEYKDVTLEELLQHRGGIVKHMTFGAAEMNRLVGLPGSATEQRAEYVREVLQLEPIGPRGQRMEYSNAGYSIAGLIAEQAAGKSWEQLLKETVFEPLKMKSAGFGWPITKDRPDQPCGHTGAGSSLMAREPDQYRLGAFMAPAGDVHCSISDFARYAAFHLAGLRGKDGALKSETIKHLHSPPGGGDGYACGWMIDSDQGGGVRHAHNGSAGTFYALMVLFPGDDLAIVMAINAAPGNHEPIARKMFEAIRAKYK